MAPKRARGSPPRGAGANRELSRPSAERNRAARRRRMQVTLWSRPTSGWVWWIGGGALAVAALVIYIVVTRPSTGGSGPVPAGVESFDEPSRSHVQGAVTYDRIPPAGGNHAPVWLNCGIYDQPVPNENAVHSLEHGSVWVTYQPSLSAADVQTLRATVAAKYDGAERYVILSPYAGLPAPIVATAWGNQLKLQTVTDPRLGQFIDHFRGGPQDLEPGAACSGGIGNPIG